MALSAIRKAGSGLIKGILKSFFKEGHYYKFRVGRLKGMRNYYRSDINLRNLMGFYDGASLELLTRVFARFNLSDRDIIVADIGANMGYYSLFFARYSTKGSRVYAFEPSVSIIDVLTKNLAVNGFGNVTVVDAACSDKPGTTTFFIGQNHHTSSMLENWSDHREHGTKTEVKTESIDHYFSGAYPDLIKMDIEGAGVFALKGAEDCLTKKRPLILMESHNPEEDAAVGELLTRHRYEAWRVNDGKWIVRKDRHYPDADGVWGTMLLMPEEEKARFAD